MSMTRSQFKRRLKRARRASQRLANDRSQHHDGAARWIATMAAAQRAGSNDQAEAARPDRTTQRPSLIGRI